MRKTAIKIKESDHLQRWAVAALASIQLLIASPVMAGNAGMLGEFEESSHELELSVPAFLPSSINWANVIDEGAGDHIDIGVRLLGPSPFDRSAESMFVPASTVKLFTAGAVLEYLGPDFRYRTYWRWDDLNVDDSTDIGNLRLVGSGDPSWGSAWADESIQDRVSSLVTLLEQAGIRRIHGPIRIEASDRRWTALEYPAGWEELDEVACYAALAQAVNLDGNCGEFVVNGPKQGRWTDPSITIPVDLELRPGRTTVVKVEPIREEGSVTRRFRIHGTFRRNGPPRRLYFPIHDSDSRLKNLLADAFQKSDMEYLPRSPMEARGLEKEIAIESEPAAKLVKRLLKDSDNLVGHALLNTLGENVGPRQTKTLLEAGQAVIQAYVSGLGGRTALLSGTTPISGFYSEQVMIHDGSGISRENRVTPEAVMTLLEDLGNRSDFGRIWDALAVAGVDGTLKSRMRGAEAEGVLRGKTGTIRGVYNLAGYIPRYNSLGIPESFVPFVILSKTEPHLRNRARAAQDRLGAALARTVNSLPDAFLKLPFNFVGGM